MAINISRLPAAVAKLPGFMPERSNKEVIIRHLVTQEGTVPLNAEQTDLLNRWNFADDLMRSFRYNSREIAERLVKKFKTETRSYSTATAWRDIDDARDVFGHSRKPRKDYLLSLHIDRLENSIALAQRQGKDMLVVKLCEVYNNALKQLPNDRIEERNPSTIMFNITTNNITQISSANITAEDAKDIAAKRMAEWGIAIDDILHEDV